MPVSAGFAARSFRVYEGRITDQEDGEAGERETNESSPLREGRLQCPTINQNIASIRLMAQVDS